MTAVSVLFKKGCETLEYNPRCQLFLPRSFNSFRGRSQRGQVLELIHKNLYQFLV